MTIDAYAAFSPCLRYRSPGNAPVWDDGCALYYFAALSEIPDADAPILMKAIMTGGCGKFRPDPDEVLTLWRKLTQPKPLAADELVAKLYTQRDRHGPYVVPDPVFLGLMKAGEPAYTDMNLKRLVAARGGWVQFCAEEANSTNAAQLLKLATVIIGGESDAAINHLRLEYLAANPPALGSEYPAIAAPADTREAYAPETHREAAQIMARIQSRTGDLRMVHLREIDAEAA